MAFSVVNIGTNNNHTGATVAATVPGGGVPSGSIIVVVVGEQNNTVGGSLADSKGNTYTPIVSLQSGITFISAYYAKNSIALVSGDIITFTKRTGNDQAVISACYITGGDTIAPLDTAITASASGVGTSPSVTGGTPGATDLQMGATLGQAALATDSFTQDTTNGWASPPNVATDTVVGKGTITITLGGGNQVSAAVKTFAPSFSTSSVWQAIIFGFVPAGAVAALPSGWNQPWIEPNFERRQVTY